MTWHGKLVTIIAHLQVVANQQLLLTVGARLSYLSQNILLCGGSSHIRGLKSRLQAQLQQLVTESGIDAGV